ncbi:hypothetical protein [Streptomyces sp. CNQ431]|uniref:hypothetical protein n=1 Tax=Streptomyces sp. CNQ431 TaxID=1571532 RepID=UPI00053D6ACF|nr:hypothetical protein [Streptomyces sp. CNQ431]
MNTLASLNRRLGVLADLTARYPELPAPHVDLGQVFTDRMVLAFHNHPAALDQWASALGIDLDTATGSTDGFSVAWLTVTFEVDGITIELISYTRLATTVETGGAG